MGGFCWGLSSSLHLAIFLLGSHMATRREREGASSLMTLLTKTRFPFMKAPSSRQSYSSKEPSPNAICWRIRISTWIWRGQETINIQSVSEDNRGWPKPSSWAYQFFFMPKSFLTCSLQGWSHLKCQGIVWQAFFFFLPLFTSLLLNLKLCVAREFVSIQHYLLKN